MSAQMIRHLIIGLLTLAGIFHLSVALLDGAPGFGWPLTIYGLIYIFLSFYVRRDVHERGKKKKGHVNGRTAMIVTAIATLTGLLYGGAYVVAGGGSAAMALMGLIKIAIITASGWWLIKSKAFG